MDALKIAAEVTDCASNTASIMTKVKAEQSYCAILCQAIALYDTTTEDTKALPSRQNRAHSIA